MSHGGLICLLVGQFIRLNLVVGVGYWLGLLLVWVTSQSIMIELILFLSLSLNPWPKHKIDSEYGLADFGFN